MRPNAKDYALTLKTDEVFELQAPADIAVFKAQLDKYLLRAILKNPDFVDDSKSQKVFQDALGAKAKDQQELKEYSFDADQRISELAVLLLVHHLVAKNNQSKLSIVPSWQTPNQSIVVESLYGVGKQSWDGYLLPTDGTNGLKPVAIELKTTGADPHQTITDTVEAQASTLIANKSDKLNDNDVINVILVYPYDPKMSIDFEGIAGDLTNVMSDSAMGVVCILDFPEYKQLRITGMLANKSIIDDANKERSPSGNVLGSIVFGKKKHIGKV